MKSIRLLCTVPSVQKLHPYIKEAASFLSEKNMICLTVWMHMEKQGKHGMDVLLLQMDIQGTEVLK